MTVDVPYEIGDPVLVVEYNQHDGYCIEAKAFSYDLLSRIDRIFKTKKEADAYIEAKIGAAKKSYESFEISFEGWCRRNARTGHDACGWNSSECKGCALRFAWDYFNKKENKK